VLASLNHPNIAHIYGVEERALVMELVEVSFAPKGTACAGSPAAPAPSSPSIAAAGMMVVNR
jgi:hypothetical protein